MDIELQNKKFFPLTPEERLKQLYEDFKKIFITSSFGTTSGILLHLLSKINPQQTVHFINTTYHFRETLEYKNTLTKLFGLHVIEITPEEWKNQFTRTDETWDKNPDFCCFINKVEPVEQIKKHYNIWCSGLMSYQNEHRKHLDVFELKNGTVKFYPIIDFSKEDAVNYLNRNNIPRHPLETQGYSSVGCFHCTNPGRERMGRWVNFDKSECGLHD